MKTPLRSSVVSSTRRKSGPVDAGDAVVLGEPLVQERVLAVDEVGDRPVLAQHGLEEHARLGAHRVRSSAFHSGNFVGSRLTASRLRVSSHWPAKLSAKRRRLRIGEHALDLRVEHRRQVQPIRLAEPQQLVVGHRAPEEVAQPRRQLDVRDARDGARPADRARCGRGNCGETSIAAIANCRLCARRVAAGLGLVEDARQLRDIGLASPAGGRRGGRASSGCARRRPRPTPGRRSSAFFVTACGCRRRERSGELDGLRDRCSGWRSSRDFAGIVLQRLVVHELGAERVLAAGKEDARLFAAALGRAALLVDGADLHRHRSRS